MSGDRDDVEDPAYRKHVERWLLRVYIAIAVVGGAALASFAWLITHPGW
jgi:hypothetical protein